jgi:hypothetical protein
MSWSRRPCSPVSGHSKARVLQVSHTFPTRFPHVSHTFPTRFVSGIVRWTASSTFATWPGRISATEVEAGSDVKLQSTLGWNDATRSLQAFARPRRRTPMAAIALKNVNIPWKGPHTFVVSQVEVDGPWRLCKVSKFQSRHIQTMTMYIYNNIYIYMCIHIYSATNYARIWISRLAFDWDSITCNMFNILESHASTALFKYSLALRQSQHSPLWLTYTGEPKVPWSNTS